MDAELLALRTRAQEIIKNNPSMHAWADLTLAIWLREGCKCIYCGRDMLQDRDVAYNWQCLEHVLPKGKYPQLANCEDNWVLACNPCNAFKYAWDPNKQSRDGRQIVDDHATSVTPEQRSELIARASRYVRSRRTPLESQFVDEKAAIKAALH
jgi:hypothetical protein